MKVAKVLPFHGIRVSISEEVEFLDEDLFPIVTPLNEANWLLYAMQHYTNPNCSATSEFIEDMRHFKYIRKLLTHYEKSGELKERLILNRYDSARSKRRCGLENDGVTMKTFKTWIKEDAVPANTMGTSSSTPGTGGIDTFDPLLFRRPVRRFKPFLNVSTVRKNQEKLTWAKKK